LVLLDAIYDKVLYPPPPPSIYLLKVRLGDDQELLIIISFFANTPWRVTIDNQLRRISLDYAACRAYTVITISKRFFLQHVVCQL